MARPEPTPAADAVTVAVIVPGRDPYAMFDAVEVTPTGGALRGPLLLELGERLRLRVARGERTVDVDARVVAVRRGDGRGEPVTEVAFDDASAATLRPLIG
jgi:hypothetical protein